MDWKERLAQGSWGGERWQEDMSTTGTGGSLGTLHCASEHLGRKRSPVSYLGAPVPAQLWCLLTALFPEMKTDPEEASKWKGGRSEK